MEVRVIKFEVSRIDTISECFDGARRETKSAYSRVSLCDVIEPVSVTCFVELAIASIRLTDFDG